MKHNSTISQKYGKHKNLRWFFQIWCFVLVIGLVIGTVGFIDSVIGDDDGFGILNFHGTDTLLEKDFEESGKYFVTATITSAIANPIGIVMVDFKVEDDDGEPVVGVTGVDFNIVKLVPAAGGESFNKWVPYIYRSQVVSGSDEGDWPNPDGTAADQGYRESGGIFIDWGNGSYLYIFETNLMFAVTPNEGVLISYDRSLTHRVSLMMGDDGPTADAVYDFVPDGSAITETRNIVETANCKACHGIEFHGHGGDRLSIENCVTCHTAGNWDPHGGETVDAKVMIHKIHAGGEVASIPGPDGKVWDDPDTEENEMDDNGEYAIWGYNDNKHEWWKVGFPAIIRNCTKCHQGSGEDVDNWKNVPSRDVCGSCHDDIDFADGTNHGGGIQESDDNCSACHPASGSSTAITEAHDWTTEDPRNIPEFTIDLSVSTPANGDYFVAGESPVVTIIIKEDDVAIDHTTVEEDLEKEGCLESGCPERDGKFSPAYLFVHGPRSKRNPVLTTTARVEVVSSGSGPFDLSAEDATLNLKVDGGQDIFTDDGTVLYSGTISVEVDETAFANTAAATAKEIVDWLNADTAFAARAIAYLEGGKVAIRSRNLGKFFSLQLVASDVTTQVFADDTAVKVVGGYYPNNAIYKHDDSTEDDPKVTWTTGSITYTLDPVDDLKPGTYMAFVEIADRGRIDGTDYKTPSVAKTTFQVGQEDEELAPAVNCGSCHQGPEGTGYVLHLGRHRAVFDNTAIDQCGSCHDYQSGNATGEWYGGKPISKRVHAVHYGSSLNYPNDTVDYTADPVAGRNWDITFPQDVRYCEACHSSDTSSGSWAIKAARTPCNGCHDSLEADAHMKSMTWDPTLADPWNGDEEEACIVCH